jgi:uncharacterized protein YndB with AHSA1/START domain
MSDAKADEFSTHVERASDRELVLRRTFRARPQIMFDAMTKAELLRRWWAPQSRGVELYECDSDVRVGGAYRFVFGKKGQPRMAFSGVYKELVPGSRIVFTQIFEQMRAAGEVLVTTTLEATAEGHTRLSSHELYPSKEALEGAMSAGMEEGLRESYDQLGALVTEL